MFLRNICKRSSLICKWSIRCAGGWDSCSCELGAVFDGWNWASHWRTFWHSGLPAIHCNTLQHTATHRNTYIYRLRWLKKQKCIHIYIHACIHTYMRTNTHTHMCTHTCTHTCTYTHANMHTHIQTNAHTHTHTHTQNHTVTQACLERRNANRSACARKLSHTQTHTYTNTHILIYMHTRTQTQIHTHTYTQTYARTRTHSVDKLVVFRNTKPAAGRL